MEKLNQIKFAITTGLVSVIIYLGCFLVMTVLGKEGLVKLSNLLIHGVDFTNIIRDETPLIETFGGAALSFIFWGVIGYLFILIYNKIK